MDAKELLRYKMKDARNGITGGMRKEYEEYIVQNVLALEAVKNARCVATYLAKGSEVDTHKLIECLRKDGKKVLVPITTDRIELVEFTSFGDLERGKFGVPEPRTKIGDTDEPDVIIVPGLAFDLDMHRVGYGKGYYDRLLKTVKSTRIGICYDFQIVEKIPRHGHDEQMDRIVTERRILYKKSIPR